MPESSIERLIHALRGQHAWGAQVGHGTFLTIDFGAPSTAGKGHGEWHLWVYMASWQLLGHDFAVSDTDTREAMMSAASRLNGQTVEGVNLEPATLSLTLSFSGQFELRIVPAPDAEDDDQHWMLFLPDGDVITAGPGRTWSKAPASAARAE